MLRLLISRLLRLGADERGAVLIKFAVALVPLFMVAGVALDVSWIMLVKQKLSNAVDAAGIAVGRHPELATEHATELAESCVDAHFPTKAPADLQAVTTTTTKKQVDITPTMTFLQMLGYNSIDITATSMVLRQLHKIELVMVLDNSGSMAG